MKKLILGVAALGILVFGAYLIFAATNDQYDAAIVGYNNAFITAFGISRTSLEARPMNWESAFIENVQDARRSFTKIKLYWEHDKRIIKSRTRASARIMNLALIADQPRPTNAPGLLAQHERVLSSLEEESESLRRSRAALEQQVADLRQRFIDLKGRTETFVLFVSTKLGAAQRNIAGDNFDQVSVIFSEVVQKIQEFCGQEELDCAPSVILP